MTRKKPQWLQSVIDFFTIKDPIREVGTSDHNYPDFIVPEFIVTNSVPEEIERIEAQPHVAETPPAVETAPVLRDVRPRSAHSDELKLEAFLAKRSNQKIVSSHDLLTSGINMSKIGFLTGSIGKYKLKRDSFVGDWTITKEE